MCSIPLSQQKMKRYIVLRIGKMTLGVFCVLSFHTFSSNVANRNEFDPVMHIFLDIEIRITWFPIFLSWIQTNSCCSRLVSNYSLRIYFVVFGFRQILKLPSLRFRSGNLHSGLSPLCHTAQAQVCLVLNSFIVLAPFCPVLYGSICLVTLSNAK